MGKKSLEHNIIEETSYLIDEIQKQNKNAFDISVIVSCFFTPFMKCDHLKKKRNSFNNIGQQIINQRHK